MNSIKVSVITIVYNNRDFIADCIESVLGQTYRNVEHIVVDGRSTDGTQEVIEKYRNRLAFYVSETDGGMYEALNKGIRRATGDVVGVLHADDLYFEPNTLKKVVKAFEQSQADLVYANGMYVQQEDPAQVKRIYKAKPFSKRYINYGWIPLHTTMYVRRELFDQFGFYDESYSIAGDYEISLRWFSNNTISKHFLDEWVVKMRMGGISTTASLQKTKSAEDLDIIRRYELGNFFTLFCKIGRKIPQYLLPRLIKYEVGGQASHSEVVTAQFPGVYKPVPVVKQHSLDI